MTQLNKDFGPRRSSRDEFSDHWNARLGGFRAVTALVAILMVAGGIAAAMNPLGVFSLVQVLVAVSLVASGISYVGSYMAVPPFFRQPIGLVVGLLAVLLGVLVLAVPTVFTATAFSLFLAFLMIVGGAWRLSAVRRARELGFELSGSSMAGSVVCIAAGAVLMVLPLLGSVAIGYLVAGYLLAGGAALLVDALAMRRL